MKNVCFILSAIISFFTCAQKASVSLSADSKNVQAGDLVTFTVKSNVEGNVNIDFPSEFIQGYGTSVGKEQVMDYNSGSVTTIYYFSQNGAFKENGTYTIQAFIKNKKAVYKSNKVTIKVEKQGANEDEISKKNTKQPVFGIIQKSKSKIYEGEPLVLEAKVYARIQINMLEAYQSFELDGGAEVHELEKNGHLLLKQENYKGTNFLTFTYGKQLLFPNTTGKIKIKPFEMALQYSDGGIFSERIGFTSNASVIEVLPLPSGAPKDFIGAVGQFELDYEWDNKQIKQGDVADLKIIISGVGNIQNINKPKLNLPKGVVVYGDPEIEEDIQYGLSGAEGKVTYTYHLQFNTDQITELAPVSISYFDPNLKKYVQLKKEKIKLQIKANPQIQNTISTPQIAEKANEKEQIPLLTTASEKENDFVRSVWFWPTVVSPVFLGFLGALFWVRRKDISKGIQEKTAGKKAYQQVIEKLQSIQKQPSATREAYQELESQLRSIGNILSKDASTNFSKGELLNMLEQHNYSPEKVAQFSSLLEQCEIARFSFQHDEEHLKQLLQESIDFMKNMHVA